MFDVFEVVTMSTNCAPTVDVIDLQDSIKLLVGSMAVKFEEMLLNNSL